jgi:FtsH-binding integral membrane protein
MIGIFGPGIISCVLMWKNAIVGKNDLIKHFVLFSLVLYLTWEIIYDFMLYGNLPRYHTTLIPFLVLIITNASEKSKKLRYIYYLTLIFSLITGFIVAYYFHVYTQAIWKVPIKEFLNFLGKI